MPIFGKAEDSMIADLHEARRRNDAAAQKVRDQLRDLINRPQAVPVGHIACRLCDPNDQERVL